MIKFLYLLSINIIFLNKGRRMIIQTILALRNNAYPFDEPISKGSIGMVQELEHFESKQMLIQRKNDLKKNCKGIQSNFIIKLQKIFEQDLCMHYIYEHVPLSLSTFIKNQLQRDQYDKFKETTTKLLFKKLTNDINALVQELTKIRIQTDLSFSAIGVQGNKLKVFVGSHFQVKRKSELLLKEQYKPQKECLLKTLEEEFTRILGETKDSPNFIIKGNSLLFSKGKRQIFSPYKNLTPSINSESIESSFCLNDTYVNCQTKDSHMNQTKQKERRYSQTKWDTNQWKRNEKDQEPLRNTQSPASINNLNFDANSKMGASHHFDDSFTSQDPNFDGKSYCHSKSIRIELQKCKKPKQRKDSYKVKVITCHEYQMDDIDSKDIFQKCNISNSHSCASNCQTNGKKCKEPTTKQQLQKKVQKAAQKAKQILNGYLHKRGNSRK